MEAAILFGCVKTHTLCSFGYAKRSKHGALGGKEKGHGGAVYAKSPENVVVLLQEVGH